MEEDVAKALAYQVKRELAERYFGFRRLIEEDSARYFQLIEETRKRFEERLAKELMRFYIMLRDKDLIDQFLKLLGLPKAYFYDQYLQASPDLQHELFKDLRPKGWTSKGKFKHLFLDTYYRLYELIQEYQETFQELVVEAEVINEEIRQFKEKFDLSEIIQFLKTFEPSPELASLGHPSYRESVSTLEKKLELGKVPPPEDFLPEIKDLPPPEEIRAKLIKLAKEAWKRHPQESKELVQSAQSNQ